MVYGGNGMKGPFFHKIEYDKEADAIYIGLNDKPVSYTRSLDDSRYIDFDEENNPIGIELLNVSSGVTVGKLPFAEPLARILENSDIKVCV
jgi:uncharacterized protein YuzE